ncbi:ABC transporter ATP-binding protein [Pararhodobacter sp. CCB-MM2]|uniref:ABC transporter ATP-binding protein n=1 Tax=Pararhodobacter sp. CCB-MM2 TaxID=1786003 RepID=UPI00083048F3|nr:ABC transporter ATP-binding protein [Pararhodobacter sp. CCB-MM2]
MAFLEVKDLHVSYQRAITALTGVSFTMEEGQIMAILGANGAGKTTTLRALSGFIGLDNARVTKGRIGFDGQDLTRRPPYEVTRQGVVLVPERDKVFPNLSVHENLEVVTSRASGTRRSELTDLVYTRFPRLAQLRKREAGLLSGGERQMLALGSAIVCAPRLLLIDELSLGLAPVIVEEIVEHLRVIRQDLSLTILLVEQSAAVAFRLADSAVVLEHGEVALTGTSEALQSDSAVQNAYLGTGTEGRRSYRAVAEARRLAEQEGRA